MHNDVLVGLSTAARSVWAKTDQHSPNAEGKSLSLVQHLADSAGIAALVWDEFLPKHIRNRLAKEMGSDNAARTIAIFLAGVHDVGKASPAFAVMAPALATIMGEYGLAVEPHVATSSERSSARHELVGLIALNEWLLKIKGRGYGGVYSPRPRGDDPWTDFHRSAPGYSEEIACTPRPRCDNPGAGAPVIFQQASN